MAPSGKLCPKLILEGTRLTRKTELAFALNEHERITGRRAYRYHSPLVSAEWCGFTNFPWGRGLLNYLPQEEALALSAYEAWLNLFAHMRYYSWIVDRFHLSTLLVQQKLHGRAPDFRALEERLAELGFRLIFCQRPERTFEQALQERLQVSGNPAQYHGVEEFIAEQEEFRELVAASSLPSLELDVSAGDLESLCNTVADWLEHTGGLWQPGEVVTLGDDGVPRIASTGRSHIIAEDK